jgi:hypothetical protein
LTIERAGSASGPTVAVLPATRVPSVVRARTVATTGSSAVGTTEVLVDEEIDIQLGFDRQSARLEIVGGDVRIAPRPAGQPAPGSLGAPATGARTPTAGSLVNFVA